MSEIRPITAQPEFDNTSSTTMSSGSRLRHMHGVPEGDFSTVSTQDVQSREHYFSMIVDPGQGNQDRAGAFYGSENFSDNTPTGTVRERIVLSESRRLDDLHINKISSQATKPLNKDLSDAIQLTPNQKEHVAQFRVRRDACWEILSIWRMQGTDNRKTVHDLKELLIRAGGVNPDKYQAMINDLVNSPP